MPPDGGVGVVAGADRCWSEAPEGAGGPPLEFRYKRTTPNNKPAIPQLRQSGETNARSKRRRAVGPTVGAV